MFATRRAGSSRLTRCMLSKSIAILALLGWGVAAQTPAAAPPGFAGSEACQPCHEDIYNTFQKSPHKRGCESCHGPGAKHAGSADQADIVNPAHLAPAQADQVCLKCHLNQPAHIGRHAGQPSRNAVGCIACHSIHQDGAEGLVLAKTSRGERLCASCHADIWAEFQRPYKHRLPEGAMSCVDCHNPHGSIARASGQSYAANEPGCFKCHGNLRGPLLSNTRRCGWKAAARAMSRTARPIRAC